MTSPDEREHRLKRQASHQGGGRLLRHSFGTAVVAAGGTGAGQALLAHSDPRMTHRYTHLADAYLGAVLAKAFQQAARAAPVPQPETGDPSDGVSRRCPAAVSEM